MLWKLLLFPAYNLKLNYWFPIEKEEPLNKIFVTSTEIQYDFIIIGA